MVSSGMATHLLLSSVLCWCAHAEVVEYEVQENQTLYFASQGWRSGVSVYQAGFYGGLVDTKRHGYQDNLTSVVMDCFLTSPNLVREDYLKTRGMSYDPVDNKILLHMFDHRRTSVFVMPRCVHTQMCSYDIIKHREDLQAKAVFSYGISSDRSEACPTVLQPFGIYANKVYFVARRILTSNDKDVLKLELRQMGCTHELFHSQHPFDIRKCSELIATLEETTPDRCHFLNTAHHLYIVPDPNPPVTSDGSQGSPTLTFLLQVFNRTDTDFSMSLMAVTKGNKPHILYTNPLPYNYHEYTDVGRHLGGIHFKDGKLCWSAITSIFCATWKGGNEMSDLETVLPPYAAASAGACYVGKCFRPTKSFKWYTTELPHKIRTPNAQEMSKAEGFACQEISDSEVFICELYM